MPERKAKEREKANNFTCCLRVDLLLICSLNNLKNSLSHEAYAFLQKSIFKSTTGCFTVFTGAFSASDINR